MTQSVSHHLLEKFLLMLMMCMAGCATGSASGRMAQVSRPSAGKAASTSLQRPISQASEGLDTDKLEAPAAIGERSSSPKAVSGSTITLASAASQSPDSSATPAANASSAADQNEPAPAPSDPSGESPRPTTEYTLSLSDVLSLAEGQNPNVALALERINEAYARVDRAETLWLPSLRAGLNYNHHEGTIQDVAGNVFQTNRSAFYGGLGANAVGAGSPAVPGVVAQFHLTDAIFQPKIASHLAASRQFGATAATNDVLRDTAVAYLELIRAEQGVAIAQESLDNTRKLAELTRQFAESGQGLQADYQRMEAELALRQDQLVSQVEAVTVASARLAQLLHADPSVPIASGEPLVIPLEILSLDQTAAEYVATGLSRRPELAEQKHLVCEATERLRREKFAPLVPSVLLGVSYGGMGGGLGNSIINTSGRWDADAVAYWEIRNLGFGERAARDETSSVIRQAQLRELALLDRVAREVTETHAQAIQRQQRLDVGKKGITAAEKSYALNQERIQNAQGLPIEVLQAIQSLATARRTYLNAVIDFNIAQFELCRAIGWFSET